jgi:hypothetical protein
LRGKPCDIAPHIITEVSWAISRTLPRATILLFGAKFPRVSDPAILCFLREDDRTQIEIIARKLVATEIYSSSLGIVTERRDGDRVVLMATHLMPDTPRAFTADAER